MGALTLRQSPNLHLKTRLVGVDTTVVSCAGELDFATRDELVELLASVEDIGVSRLVIDLSMLTFIDSAGLHELIATHRRARAGGWHVQFACAPGPVWRTLMLSGVTSELDFVTHPPEEPPAEG
jgi:anti-sigma B factor antagonist